MLPPQPWGLVQLPIRISSGDSDIWLSPVIFVVGEGSSSAGSKGINLGTAVLVAQVAPINAQASARRSRLKRPSIG